MFFKDLQDGKYSEFFRDSGKTFERNGVIEFWPIKRAVDKHLEYDGKEIKNIYQVPGVDFAVISAEGKLHQIGLDEDAKITEVIVIKKNTVSI